MKRQKRTISIIAICLFSVALVFAIAFGLLVVFIYKDIDFQVDEKLFDSSRSFESTLFYAEGEVVESSGSIRKLHYSLDEISPYVSRGFIAVEDRMFYEHSGVDIKRTALAAINLIVKKDDTFGASTITQQVIKNISGDNQVKIRRKICEILRALHIERIYTKNDILEVYLNVIPMGDNIYGVGAASRAYFGKEPSDLSVEEAATLIGRVLMASRLSSPVLVQVRLMRSEPTKSTTISEKYWLIIWLAGTKSKMALMPMGSSAVTAMSTGLVIHHIPIQMIVPSANALLKPK